MKRVCLLQCSAFFLFGPRLVPKGSSDVPKRSPDYELGNAMPSQPSIHESVKSRVFAFPSSLVMSEPMEGLMKVRSVNRICLLAVCCVLMEITGCISSSQSGEAPELLSVVAISRHGIRSPTSTQATMDLYTTRPLGFPQWAPPADVAGQLSTVGQQNAARLGAWYRDFYAAQGLLPPRGTCPAAGTVFAYADLFERTLHTAQGYVDGMFQSEAIPDCGVQVIQSDKPIDPYIDTARTGICAIDTVGDLAAFNAKTDGGNSASLIKTYSTQIAALQAVTQCCQPAACKTLANPTPISCSLLDLPTTVNSNGSVGFTSGSLFDVADALSETLELEYAQGMSDTDCATAPGARCLGWGAIPPGGLQDMTKLHVLNMVDLTCQLPSYAQVGSSNLMWQVVGTMGQALSGVKNPEMLAPTESKFTLIVAHDENISAIAGFLGGLTWKADGFEQNDPGPAGALVFELYRVKQSEQTIVRLFYVIASLDQMRSGTTLTLDTPPQRIPLAIPACGGLLDCPYDQFKSFITAHVRPDCLIPSASQQP
jgi:4-phytase/acid phosphatase